MMQQPTPATLVYAGFWPRALAALLDSAILSVISLSQLLFAGAPRETAMLGGIANTAFGILLGLFLTVRYGGQPGKLIVGLRIALVDGSPVTLRAALLRMSVGTALIVASTTLYWRASAGLAEGEFISLSHAQRTLVIGQFAGPVFDLLSVLTFAWGIAELVTLLFNRQRRAVHDYIAGTVVVFSGRGLFRSRAVRST